MGGKTNLASDKVGAITYSTLKLVTAPLKPFSRLLVFESLRQPCT